MARVTGRDVLLEMLEAVGQLKSSAERHEVDFQRLNTRMDSMSERMEEMAGRMGEMAEQMGALAAEASFLRGSMVAMSDDMTAFAGDLKHLAEGHAESRVHLGRLARLLTEYAGSNDDRMNELEARVMKLEKKSA